MYYCEVLNSHLYCMAPDKYAAVWVSHSSLGDYLKCPRCYYYKNVYRNPKTGNKIKLITPSLSLGSVVHNVIEELSVLPTEKRFSESLIKRFEEEWEKLSGKRGGFFNKEQESRYKKRGEEMIRRVMNYPGPLKNKAVKIQMDLPFFWLSEEENIILCGKIDWLEYLPETDSVHIIDFKTSPKKEDGESLQLPIYHLLVKECQNRGVEKASYWYLESNNYPTEKELPDLEKSREKILKLAKKVKLARQLQSFECKDGEKNCMYCRLYKEIIDGKGELVGTDEYKTDIFILPREESDENREGEIL